MRLNKEEVDLISLKPLHLKEEKKKKSLFKWPPFFPSVEEESGQSAYIVIDIDSFDRKISFKQDQFQVINLLPWRFWPKEKMVCRGFRVCLKSDLKIVFMPFRP